MSHRLSPRATAGAALAFSTLAAFAQDAPTELRPPANEKVVLAAWATGSQVYECSSDLATYAWEWRFKGPEAELHDKSGAPLGKHYAGPTWELPDGSKVVGEVRAQAAAADAGAVPLLLLSAKSNSGTGALRAVRSVQRLDTWGGRAPAESCSQGTAGKVVRVPYRATYYFYAPDAAQRY
jgi:hypothetical protein